MKPRPPEFYIIRVHDRLVDQINSLSVDLLDLINWSYLGSLAPDPESVRSHLLSRNEEHLRISLRNLSK